MSASASCQADRQTLFLEFQNGRQCFSFYCLMKTTSFERFPLVIGSMAHDDLFVARQYASKLLAMYEQNLLHGNDSGDITHPAVALLFEQGTAGRASVEAFVRTGDAATAIAVATWYALYQK